METMNNQRNTMVSDVQIVITWQAYGNRPESNRFIKSATLMLDPEWKRVTNDTLLDQIYTATNLQSELEEFGYSQPVIQLWNSINKVLPTDRTHTSLSVGDVIQINRSKSAIEFQDGATYKIAETGFELIAKVNA